MLIQTRLAPMSKRILVVFYSRTGNTKKVAEAVAGELGADVEEIKSADLSAGVPLDPLRQFVRTDQST